MNIDSHKIVQYMVLFSVPFLLIWCHNWLHNHVKQEINQELETGHDETKEKIAVSLALFIGTIVLMLFFAPSLPDIFNGYGLFAIAFALISSFLMSRFFLSVQLKEMINQPILVKVLIYKNFLMTLLFMVATELLVLYWLKEVNIYAQEQFIAFVISYSVLITMGGIFLGFPKQKGHLLHDEWHLTLITIIDPIIIVFFAGILVKIILDMILYFL